MAIMHNLAGRRFGAGIAQQAIQKRDPCGRARIWWDMLCDCGKRYQAPTGNLTTGRVQSCGHLADKERRRKGRVGRAPGQSMALVTFRMYQRSAKLRGYEFELSFEQFYGLVKQPCDYCGIEPQRARLRQKYNGAFVSNGIDRTDPKKGYSAGNVVPCCTACNMAKGKMSREEFLALVKRIAQQMGGRFQL